MPEEWQEKDDAITSNLQALTQGYAPVQPLCSRERSVMELALRGKTTDQIATILGLSPTTAKGYRSSALGKLHATNRTQAAYIMYATGIMPVTYRPRHHHRLSTAQAVVLKHVAYGDTTKAIAAQLGYSSLTIRDHIAEVSVVFTATGRPNIVSQAFTLGYFAYGGSSGSPQNPSY